MQKIPAKAKVHNSFWRKQGLKHEAGNCCFSPFAGWSLRCLPAIACLCYYNPTSNITGQSVNTPNGIIAGQTANFPPGSIADQRVNFSTNIIST